MSTTFNLPRSRTDPLGQALNQLPQFLLGLGELQQRKKERVDRAQRQVKVDQNRKTAFEVQLINMAAGGDDADVKVASIPGLERAVTTPTGRQAVDLFSGMAREQQQQLRKDEAQKAQEKAARTVIDAQKNLFGQEIAKLKIAIDAAAVGVEGADSLVTAGLNNISTLGGVQPEAVVPPSPQGATEVPNTLDPLGLGIQQAGFGERLGEVAPATTGPSLDNLFNVSDPTTLGGLVAPTRQDTLSTTPVAPFSSESLLRLLNAAAR